MNPRKSYSENKIVITRVKQGRSLYWSATGWHSDVKYAERFHNKEEAQRWIDQHAGFDPSYREAFPERVGKLTKSQFSNPRRSAKTVEQRVAIELHRKFGYSKKEARQRAANEYGSNVSEIVRRIVRSDTHRSVGGLRNPRRSFQRIGRALEVRYHRTIGRQPGFYKHEIESRKAGVYTIPEGWIYVPGKSILITEGKPRV